MKNKSKKDWKPRVVINFNTGTRAHRAKKGGAFNRNNKHKVDLCLVN